MKSLLRKIWPARWLPGAYVHSLVRSRTQQKVWSGPFRGMHYIDYSFYSALMPKFIGIYEKELHRAVNELIAWRPDLVIDIGAAEGYYAVGLARCLPESEVVAFEANEGARAQLQNLSQLNHCRNVRVHGLATPDSLSALTVEKGCKVAVISDCEGAELELLSPSKFAWLGGAFIICELHDFLQPGTEKALVERFRNTHRVELIPAVPRTPDDFPFHNLMSRLFLKRYVQIVLGESRPGPMQFLVATPIINDLPGQEAHPRAIRSPH